MKKLCYNEIYISAFVSKMVLSPRNGQGSGERNAVCPVRRERIYPFRVPGASSECMNAFPTRGGGRFGYDEGRIEECSASSS